MRHPKLFRYSLIALTGVAATACGGGGRVLIVRSEPADAEVCIKGRAKSEYFSNVKSCVGTTPFEADKVDVPDSGGDKHTVKFKDVEADKEKFYVLVTHPGYQAASVEVPGWEHNIVLKPVGGASAPATPAPVPVAAVAAQPATAQERGSVKITTEPVGALVYVNDALKGNTPFTYEGPAGVVRLKLELSGYQLLEKALTIEPGQALNLNFKLAETAAPNGGASAVAAKPSAQKTVPAEKLEPEPTAPQASEAAPEPATAPASVSSEPVSAAPVVSEPLSE